MKNMVGKEGKKNDKRDGNGESRHEIKKEGTKFLEENWNPGEKV